MIGALPTSAFTFDTAVNLILDSRTSGRHLSVHFCTAHTVVEASRSEVLRVALRDESSVNTPDGMPLVWTGRLKGHVVERVYGPDVMLAVLDRGRKTGHRHYFYGGAPGVVERLVAQMRERYPGLQVAGFETPPFRPLTEEEDRAAVARINEARPDCVWVGLGAPKQDFWVYEHRERLQAGALLAVGAAFDFHSGTKRQAPHWMQRSGTEWLFRLLSEPRRLWRRYTVMNVQFALVLLADLMNELAARLFGSKTTKA